MMVGWSGCFVLLVMTSSGQLFITSVSLEAKVKGHPRAPRADLVLLLSRSLIFCRSTTNEECSEEGHAGSASRDLRTWIPGWKTDACESSSWRRSQPSPGGNTPNLVPQATCVRDSKRSIRRSFSIKVGLHQRHHGVTLMQPTDTLIEKLLA